MKYYNFDVLVDGVLVARVCLKGTSEAHARRKMTEEILFSPVGPSGSGDVYLWYVQR